MELKILNNEEITCIFKEHIIYDFPLAEQRPLKNMLSLKNRQRYYCLGLYENELLGYAFFAGDLHKKVILLDYFAIVKGKRSAGYGSQFIELLKQEFKDCLIIAEVESVESTKDPKEKELRQRRIDFYLENGLYQSGITCCLFGVHYKMLYLNECKVANDVLFKQLKALYLSIFNYLICLLFIKIKK